MYFDGNGTIFEEYEPNFNFATKGHGQIPSDGPTFGATNWSPLISVHIR